MTLVRLYSRLLVNSQSHIRWLSSNAAVPEQKTQSDGKRARKMSGWQIHSYGELEELIFSSKLRIPAIRSSTDVLVRVQAAGVNPIDLVMIGGYGSKFFNTLRCNRGDIEFPITLGREFAGTIVQKGMGTDDRLSVGDRVFGIVPLHKQGCHAEYVTVPETCVSTLPADVSTVEASSILYAGLTAWSGLFISGQLGGIEGALTANGGGRSKRVLVLGASGGVGSTAVQILKAEKAIVVASCATDAVPIVQGLGVRHVIDYTRPEQLDEFAACGPYDIILDCAGLGPNYATNFGWQFRTYVTFSSPLLRNIDQHGMGIGMIRNLADLVEQNAKTLSTRQGCVKWGYFVPALHGIEYLKKLINRKKLLPIMDSTYSYEDVLSAYKRVKEGHLRGKVAIDYELQANQTQSDSS